MKENNIDLGKSFEKIKAQPFQMNYNREQLGEIYGYLKALNDLSHYLQLTTEFKPENRYIDAVPILEAIKEASAKITVLLSPPVDDIPSSLFRKSQDGESNLHPVFENIVSKFCKPKN